MTSALDCDRLQQAFVRQEGLAGELLAVLETEYAVVMERDTAELERVIDRKRGLIEALEELQQQNVAILGVAGIGGDRRGMEEAIGRCGTTAAETAWQAMRDKILACERQNTINGKLLESSKRVTQQALSILLGNATGAGELYTQSGKATAPTLGGKTIVKA